MNIKAIFFTVIIAALALTACVPSAYLATSTPTVVPTPTIDPLQSAKVVQAFWDAMAAGDLETAMVYVDDEVTCAGKCYFTGKYTLRTVLQGYLEGGYITEISDVKNVGSIVTYSWEVYRNGNFIEAGNGNEVMQVENGKIIYWENQHR
jgi:hypothetical protein